MLQVSVEVAPLVEIALGQSAQHVVAVRSQQLLDQLPAESGRLGGRVGFVWLEGARGQGSEVRGQRSDYSPLSPLPLPSPPTSQAGRACSAARPFRAMRAPLRPAGRPPAGPHVVRREARSRPGLAHTVGAGLSYVTLAGELLEPDGTLVVGPRNVATGLISRRSQLRALRVQLDELETAIQAAAAAAAKLADEIAALERSAGQRSAEYQQTLTAAAENRQSVATAEDRRSQLDQQRASLDRELHEAEAEHELAERSLAEARRQREQADAALQEMESGVRQLDGQHRRVGIAAARGRP